MYESFYGLKEKPFKLLPDPQYLYMSKSHDNAYTHLEYAITENKGFVIVTGEIGSGKTTLLNYLLSKIPQSINVGLINNTYIPSNQILKVICQEFELTVEGKDKALLLGEFQDFLLEQFSRKKRVILFIDEAQNLSPAAMEEVRLLSNLEAEKSHLIQIILVGQPELRFKLQRNDLKQFAQRVSVHCHLKGLDNGEVQQYIRHRLKAAGAKRNDLFNKDAIELIAKYSNGIPRIINVLCDTALVYGFADSQKNISKEIVLNVIDAREAGGILKEGFVEPEKRPYMEERIEDEKGKKSYELRLNSFEKRLISIENMTASMDRRVTQLMEKKDERDFIVLELIKMLKSSIENRLNLVAKFNQLRKQVEKKKSDEPIEGKKEIGIKKREVNSIRKVGLWLASLVAVIFFIFLVLEELIF